MQTNYTGINTTTLEVSDTANFASTVNIVGAIAASGGITGPLIGGIGYTRITNKAFSTGAVSIANVTLTKSIEIISFSNVLANGVTINVTPTTNSIVMLHVDKMNTLGTATVNFVGAGVRWDTANGAATTNGNSTWSITAFPGYISNGMQISHSGLANIKMR